MVQIENLPLVLTGLGLTASILYYTMTLRNANRTQRMQLETRQAQMFVNIYSKQNSDEAHHNEFEIMNIEIRTADDYLELYQDKIKYTALQWYMSFYEGMGVLVRQNLVDIALVSQMLSGGIIWFWERYRDAFLDCRVRMNWPRFMIELEYLYERVKEYMLEYHPDVGVKSPTPKG